MIRISSGPLFSTNSRSSRFNRIRKFRPRRSRPRMAMNLSRGKNSSCKISRGAGKSSSKSSTRKLINPRFWHGPHHQCLALRNDWNRLSKPKWRNYNRKNRLKEAESRSHPSVFTRSQLSRRQARPRWLIPSSLEQAALSPFCTHLASSRVQLCWGKRWRTQIRKLHRTAQVDRLRNDSINHSKTWIKIFRLFSLGRQLMNRRRLWRVRRQAHDLILGRRGCSQLLHRMRTGVNPRLIKKLKSMSSIIKSYLIRLTN